MKVEKITAYRSDDSCIWETEQEAIENNITDIFCLMNIDDKDTYGFRMEKLKNFFKEHKKEIKYVLANIDKI